MKSLSFSSGWWIESLVHTDSESGSDVRGEDRQREGGVWLSGGGLGLPAPEEDQGPRSQEAWRLGRPRQDRRRDGHQTWGSIQFPITCEAQLARFRLLTLTVWCCQDWDKPENIPDPDAKKPDDWDEDMDGEWEPAVIPNPEYKVQIHMLEDTSTAFQASDVHLLLRFGAGWVETQTDWQP